MTDPDPLPRLAVLVAVAVVFTASAVGGYTTYASYTDEETVGTTFQAAADFGPPSSGNTAAVGGPPNAGNTQGGGLAVAGNTQGGGSASETEADSSSASETEATSDGGSGPPSDGTENDTTAVVRTVLLAAPTTAAVVGDNRPPNR